MAFQSNAAPSSLPLLQEQYTTATNMTVDSLPFTTITKQEGKMINTNLHNTQSCHFPNSIHSHLHLLQLPQQLATTTQTLHPPKSGSPLHQHSQPTPLQAHLHQIWDSLPHGSVLTSPFQWQMSITPPMTSFLHYAASPQLHGSLTPSSPFFQKSNFPPLTQESDNFKSVHNLKHYLKDSNIDTLLKQESHDFSTLRAYLQVHSSICATSIISQSRPTLLRSRIRCKTHVSHTSSLDRLSCDPVNCLVIGHEHSLLWTKPIHYGTAISIIGQGWKHK